MCSNFRMADLDFLSQEEVGFLKQLQKQYKQETKPPGLRETPVAIETGITFSDVCTWFSIK